MISTMEQVRCTADKDDRRLDSIRAKFREVFGRDCVLRDDALLQKYNLTAEGDLIMFVR